MCQCSNTLTPLIHRNKSWYCVHFTDAATEALRGETTCLKSQGYKKAESRFDAGMLALSCGGPRLGEKLSEGSLPTHSLPTPCHPLLIFGIQNSQN